MANADDTTVTLPRRYIQLIDRAFNRAVTESETETAATREGKRPHKRRSNGTRNSNIQTSSGEYIFDEQESNGGFIPEDGDKHRGFGEITHIPLSAIPRALQLLDLPPDDAEVLNVFANAASGWRVPTDQDDDRPGSHEAVVSRRDWHAVCAVILPAVPGQHRDSEDEQSQSDSPSSHNASDSSDLDGTSEEDYLPRETAHRSRSSLTGGSHHGDAHILLLVPKRLGPVTITDGFPANDDRY
ncbi:hypothetical protein EW145_g1913 [Phellinidium pouzarii]|uniref:Uncharacterized protein n=1 Tax=Phellinidium pouzarii TaxID=167371 RepID=A0A4S4LEM3_9AGAM|nr:hypothetical protein EW145_g1913 [Phellinidium pouzarii]